jgi:dihydrofolate reductase
LSADLRHFKALTMGHHILMGRRTYDSIGKALPGRTNWVLRRASDFKPADCKVVRTLDEAQMGVGGEGPLMVIGGAEIYRLCLPQAQRIHLTLVHTKITDGDTFFSAWRDPEWTESSRERHEADEKNACAYSFVTLERTARRAGALL